MTRRAVAQSASRGDCVLRLHGCPCGYYGDTRKACTCSEGMVSCYAKRLSGPAAGPHGPAPGGAAGGVRQALQRRLGEPSAAIRGRVAAARERQWLRFASTHLTCNADMGVAEVRRHCQPDTAGHALLRAAVPYPRQHRYIKSWTRTRAISAETPRGRWARGPPSARTGSMSSSAGRSVRFQNRPMGITSPHS